MSGARSEIMGAIRRRLKASADDGTRAKTVRDRIAAHGRNLIPGRGLADRDDLVDRFQGEAERAHATVARVAANKDIPRAVADYLASRNLPARVKLTPDPLLRSADWDSAPTLERRTGKGDGADTAGVSRAYGGIAETGTLFFTSGPDNPTTNNFLPLTHIAVVRASDIGGSYEDMWSRLRSERTGKEGGGGERFMPRAVNWITGPSRTADIELTLFLGAHGPKNLHIIVIEDDEN